MQVRDGPGPLSELIKRFCGNSLPPTITSSSNQMWITFVSENGVTANTFSAIVSGVPCKYTLRTRLEYFHKVQHLLPMSHGLCIVHLAMHYTSIRVNLNSRGNL